MSDFEMIVSVSSGTSAYRPIAARGAIRRHADPPERLQALSLPIVPGAILSKDDPARVGQKIVDLQEGEPMRERKNLRFSRIDFQIQPPRLLDKLIQPVLRVEPTPADQVPVIHVCRVVILSADCFKVLIDRIWIEDSGILAQLGADTEALVPGIDPDQVFHQAHDVWLRNDPPVSIN